MLDLTQENDARQSLLDCLYENQDITLYSTGMDKCKLMIERQETNQEIGQWINNDQLSLLQSLDEYNSKQKNECQISKSQGDSQSYLQQRFLQNNRRLSQGHDSNNQTMNSTFTNNNSNINRIKSNRLIDESDQMRISSSLSNQNLQKPKHYKKYQSKENKDNLQNFATNSQKYEDIKPNRICISPNYIQKKQIEYNKLKNMSFIQDKNIIDNFNDNQIIQKIKLVENNQSTKRQDETSGSQNRTNIYREIKYKQRSISSNDGTSSIHVNQQNNYNFQNRDDQNEKNLFNCLNYYDVSYLQGEEAMQTITLKNNIKKYKNQKLGTNIGIIQKKNGLNIQNQKLVDNLQINNSLDINNLKLIQNNSTQLPQQLQKFEKKKQNNMSDEGSLSERFKDQYLDICLKNEQLQQNNPQDLQKFSLSIMQIKNPNLSPQEMEQHALTQRNSQSQNESPNLSDLQLDQDLIQSSQNSSPLKYIFKYQSPQKKQGKITKRSSIRGGGGFYYGKNESIENNLQQPKFSQNIQIQQFANHEKMRQALQLQKQYQKEQEISQIQYDLNQRETSYSPTQIVNKYNKLMREDHQLQKNTYYVNKKLNKIERKRTIEEILEKSPSPINQILDADNMSSYIKQNSALNNDLVQKQLLIKNNMIKLPQNQNNMKQKKYKVLPELIECNNSTLGSAQYTKFKKWQGDPLFNLQNNDLNRNEYFNSGFPHLLNNHYAQINQKSKVKQKNISQV